MASILDCAVDNIRESVYGFRFNLIGFLTKPRLLYRYRCEYASFWTPSSSNGTEFRSAFQNEYGKWELGSEYRCFSDSTYLKSGLVKV